MRVELIQNEQVLSEKLNIIVNSKLGISHLIKYRDIIMNLHASLTKSIGRCSVKILFLDLYLWGRIAFEFKKIGKAVSLLQQKWACIIQSNKSRKGRNHSFISAHMHSFPPSSCKTGILVFTCSWISLSLLVLDLQLELYHQFSWTAHYTWLCDIPLAILGL